MQVFYIYILISFRYQGYKTGTKIGLKLHHDYEGEDFLKWFLALLE